MIMGKISIGPAAEASQKGPASDQSYFLKTEFSTSLLMELNEKDSYPMLMPSSYLYSFPYCSSLTLSLLSSSNKLFPHKVHKVISFY